MATIKRLIVCCDGTWQNLEKDYPTNVVKLAQAVQTQGQDPNGAVQQVLYYDEGVGAEGGVSRLTTKITSVVGGAFGRGIDKNIMDAYRFLVLNYDEGDEIFLFGFSRGAYSVRSLAGFIGASGLLERQYLRYIDEAYAFYRYCGAGHRNGCPSKREDVARYRQFMSQHKPRPVPIKLLGCWDTVGSLGIPDIIPFIPLDRLFNRRYRFHDNKAGTHIQNVRHAVAIDERRRQFMVTLFDAEDPAKTDVKEVWFPGDHGGIGGGSFEKRGLSDIALKWMLDEASGLQLASDTGCIEVQVTQHYKQPHQVIERGLRGDHSAFVDPSIQLPYTKLEREIAAIHAEQKVSLLGHGSAPDPVFHDSARMRWRDCSWWRPDPLKRFSADFHAWASAHPDPATQIPASGRLSPGEQVEVEVDSETTSIAAQGWQLTLKAGESYRFEVSPPQVWKDGKLRPCSADGWDRRDIQGLRRAWRLAIWASEKKRVSADANWLELIGEVQGDQGHREAFRIGAFPKDFSPTLNGALFCCANDLPSMYENNQGRIRLRITRLS